jgi:hypothetical protein
LNSFGNGACPLCNDEEDDDNEKDEDDNEKDGDDKLDDIGDGSMVLKKEERRDLCDETTHREVLRSIALTIFTMPCS